MTRHRVVAALLLAAALTACDKNAVQEIAGPAPASRIKFFNFGVNAPAVNFYVDNTKFTAISSTSGVESTNGVAYGSVGSGGFYAGIAPGTYTVTGRIAAATDKDLVIATIPATIADGKSYSVYMSGFYNTTTKTSDGFIVPDDYPAQIDYTVAYVRFVHGIANANPLTLYALNTTTSTEVPVGAEISYKGAGAFVSLPGGVYNLGARYTGVGTNAIARTSVSFVAGRVYSINARGDITVTSGTATNRPFLDNTAIR